MIDNKVDIIIRVKSYKAFMNKTEDFLEKLLIYLKMNLNLFLLAANNSLARTALEASLTQDRHVQAPVGKRSVNASGQNSSWALVSLQTPDAAI